MSVTPSMIKLMHYFGVLGGLLKPVVDCLKCDSPPLRCVLLIRDICALIVLVSLSASFQVFDLIVILSCVDSRC